MAKLSTYSAVTPLTSDTVPVTNAGATHNATISSILAQVPRSSVVIGPSTAVADYVCTGSGDQATINTALSAVGAASSRLLSGTYNISGLINPVSFATISGEGYGTLLQLGSGTGKTIKLQSLTGVTLRDLRVDGTNIASSNAYCTYVDSCTDLTFDRVWMVNATGFGIFLSATSAAGGATSKVRVINSYLTGRGNADVLGGGPGDATSTVSELIITGNYIAQGVGVSPGTYANAIDIVAQQRTVIAHNETQGSILLGGEKIPHLDVSVHDNIVRPAQNSTYGRIAILCASNAAQSADSKDITIANNHITTGHIFAQGQSSTSNYTRKLKILNNDVVGVNNGIADEISWGIDLTWCADVQVHGNVIDGSTYGLRISNISGIDISNNRFLNCGTPIVIASGVTGLTGHNNIGVNPDVLYAAGNVTGLTTFDRVNGIHQTATLTGSITVTLPSTIFSGEMMTLELTQDGTGSRTVTWPSNFKKAGGTLTLSTSGSAKDIISMRWDGTNWVETSRAMGVI